MNKIYLRNNETIKSDVEVLYNSAFPENERPPFFWFYNIFKNTKDNHIVGYYEENQFIGFVQYVIYLDCVYISYLAVSSSLRNQGYGTRILNDIRQSFPDYTILLCFEEVEPKYVDYHSRCNRQAFYKRNGYIDNGLKTQEGDVIYQSAYNGKHRINFSTYEKLFDLVYGPGACKRYLKCVKEY